MSKADIPNTGIKEVFRRCREARGQRCGVLQVKDRKSGRSCRTPVSLNSDAHKLRASASNIRSLPTRLIARDTVEEKVLALQETKRALADAILGASTSLVRDLGREDIELLLS